GLTNPTVEAIDRLLSDGTRAKGRQRDPPIRETSRATEHDFALATHPHGNRPLHRQRIDPGVGHAMPPAVVGHELTGPQTAHHLELFLDPPTAVRERFTQRLELDRVPAHADAQTQPSV